jgi:hypothetical protein
MQLDHLLIHHSRILLVGRSEVGKSLLIKSYLHLDGTLSSSRIPCSRDLGGECSLLLPSPRLSLHFLARGSH